MRKKLTILAAGLTGLLLSAWTHGVPTPSGNYAFISANAASPGFTIPANFQGIAIEKTFGGLGAGYFTSSATALISIFQELGSIGRFSVGGAGCQLSEATPVSLATIQALHDFLQAAGNGGSGWTNGFLWCLSAPPSWTSTDITNAETEVGYVEQVFGSGVATYAVNNEPDNTVSSGYSTVSQFITAFNAFYTPIHALYPTAEFEGPELADSTSTGAGWISAFTAAESSVVKFESEHFYTGGGFTTPGQLMAQLAARAGGPPNNNRTIQDPVYSAPLPMISDQDGTSDVSGGVAGLSNAAIASDWFAAMTGYLANAKWIGLALEIVCNTSNVYSPINAPNCAPTNPAWYVTPMFAGLRVFWNIGGARVLPGSQQGYGANIELLGLLTPSNGVEFLVANLDTVNQVSIVVKQPGSWSTATVNTAGGTSPSSLTGQVNGVDMSTSGACSTPCPPSIVPRGGFIVIPAGNSAFITLH